MEFTSGPKQDAYEDTLSADIDASQTTIGVNSPPDFALASGKVYAVIDYDKPSTKIEVISFTGISGSNLTGITRGVPTYDGGPSTAQTHAAGAKVIISDNWQVWDDIATAIATKADSGANSDITSLSALSTPLSVAQGGTAGVTAAAARTNLSAAASGANSDITSLSALSTPLSVPQGGTGNATLTTGNVIIGAGTSAVTFIAPGAASNVLASNGSAWVSDAMPAGAAHQLLDSVNHDDSVDGTVTQGSIVYGNSTPKWDELTIGSAGEVLKVNDAGTEPEWGAAGQKLSHAFVGGNMPSSFERLFRMSDDGLTLSGLSGTTMYAMTRNSASSQWQGQTAVTGNATGWNNPTKYTNYLDGSTNYLVGRKTAASTLRRTDMDGSNGTDLTISGTAQTNYDGSRAYDSGNGYLLQHDDATTSTTIRRYTISGTTVTNISSDITLSAAPTAPLWMSCDGTYIYMMDVVSSQNVLKRFAYPSGTFVDSYAISSSSPKQWFIEDENGKLHVGWAEAGSQPLGFFVELNVF